MHSTPLHPPPPHPHPHSEAAGIRCIRCRCPDEVSGFGEAGGQPSAEQRPEGVLPFRSRFFFSSISLSLSLLSLPFPPVPCLFSTFLKLSWCLIHHRTHTCQVTNRTPSLKGLFLSLRQSVILAPHTPPPPPCVLGVPCCVLPAASHLKKATARLSFLFPTLSRKNGKVDGRNTLRRSPPHSLVPIPACPPLPPSLNLAFFHHLASLRHHVCFIVQGRGP
ncbi:MAG: hypothetical protein J3Q66DRAFT_150620 [Benniella sp.]|nr:MAG: hypothetical protein J3Q66DRAFT_150620 [Benniella sp.]